MTRYVLAIRASRAFQLSQAQLFHLPKRACDPLDLRGIIARQPTPHLARHDLPRHPELVLEPSALDLLAPVRPQLLPEVPVSRSSPPARPH
jgi:hypothetical protein